MSQNSRVVVTGLGALSPVGNTAQATWQALVAAKSGVGHVTQFDASRYSVRIAAEVKGFDPTNHIDAKEARRMARCSQFAVVAAREAAADAGLDLAAGNRERVGVAIGTGIGGIEILVDPIARLERDGFTRPTPHQALEPLCNMPGFHITYDLGCLGPLTTLVTACAAGAQAVGEALEWIRRGAADVVLAGGTEAQSADAYHIAQLQATGDGAARCMRWALADAGVRPADVQYINAHGTGTLQNDPAETAAIKTVFGKSANAIPVSSTKSMIGHCFGAAGAIEAIATVMSLYTDTIHPTIILTHPDLACDLDYVPNTARRCTVNVALNNSFGLGGYNACLVLGKYSD